MQLPQYNHSGSQGKILYIFDLFGEAADEFIGGFRIFSMVLL